MNYPNFIKPKQFYSINSSQDEVEALVRLSENLKKIHLLTTKNYTDFQVLIDEYLKTGLDIFQMEIGIVSQIIGNEYIVCDAVTPDNSLKEGDIFPLEGTYCYEVFKSKKVLGFPNVGSMEEMKNHPVYINMKLESYISAPIYKNNILFGTLNFTSTKTREHGFSEHEQDLISLMANAIGSFLELREKEQKIIERNNKLKKLNGYVAHDLRTPLGNISSLVELYRLDEDSDIEEILNDIDKCSHEAMDIVENILESFLIEGGKVKVTKKDTLLKAEIERVALEFKELSEFKGIKLNLDLCDGIVNLDAKRMSQVFSNLISNSIKYGKANSDVSLVLNKQEDGHYFEITNALDVAKVKETQVGTKLKESVGLGLELAKTIVESHGFGFKVDEGEDYFKVSLKLS